MKGPGLPAMAWRNLWRNRRRTLLTLSSIAFGTMLAILMTGFGDSNFSDMIDLAARMGGGHVSLQHPEYLDTPTFNRSAQDVSRLGELALDDPDVDRVTPRISGQVMLSTAGQSYGAAFVAFDPAREDTSTLSLLEALDSGEIFDSPGHGGILLGAKLAENLDAPLGRKVVYTLTDKEGEIVYGVARVSGILRTGAPSADAGLALLPIDSVREALGYAADEVTQVAVFLSDQRRARAVAARLGAKLDGEAVAVTWRDSQPELAGFIAMKVAGAWIMEGIIMVLVAAGIFNTIFVSVMERLREFGIMLAIGFSPGRLFRLVIWESLWLGVVGLGAAAALTAVPYWYLSTRGVDISGQIGDAGDAEIAGVAVSTLMRVDIFPENLVLIALAVLIATLISGVYPALQAGRVEPADAIRLG